MRLATSDLLYSPHMWILAAVRITRECREVSLPGFGVSPILVSSSPKNGGSKGVDENDGGFRSALSALHLDSRSPLSPGQAPRESPMLIAISTTKDENGLFSKQ
jgi:hypothetical protein